MGINRKEWRIHIGAHKTATTHLQEVLDAHRLALSRAGIHYPDNGRLKRLGSAPALRDAWWKNLRQVRMLRIRRIMRTIESEATHPVVLVSNERLMGSIEGLWGENYYPDAPERLKELVSAIDSTKATVFLSLRSHASFLPSAYCQCLRTQLWDVPPLRELEPRSLANLNTWTDLVRRLKRACPGVRLVAWRFEDYLRDPCKYMDLLAGTRTAEPWPKMDAPASTRRLSWEAVERLSHIDRGLSRMAREAVARGIADEDTGATPFRPFSAKAEGILEDLYDRDIESLRKEFPGLLVE